MRGACLRGAFLVLAAAGLLAGCPGSTTAEAARPPVARIGDRTIQAEDLLVVLQGLARQGELPRDDGFAALLGRTLDARIVEEVLLTEAAARKLSPTPAEVEAAMAELLGPDPSQDVQEAAAKLHGGVAGWRAVVERRLTINTMEQALRVELAEGTSVTPEQVEAAMSRYADRLARPPRLRARQLFDEDPELVRSLHARLEAGESWEALAEEIGAEDGGDLGSLSEESAPTLLVQATAQLEPGEHTGVLRSPLGYHIFQLRGRTPAGVAKPEAAAEMVEQWLVEETVESRLRAWIAAKTDALGLEIDEDARAAVRCCRDGEPFLAPLEEKR